MLRQPAVAGYFYHGTPSRLRDQVESFLLQRDETLPALGIVAPHAGLVYSGSVAGAVYSSIDIPGTIVLIGPNHTGLGAPVSIMLAGEWETPLGTVKIDGPLASSILSRSKRIHEDQFAHLREHSLEVQLPFLQHFKQQCAIVPIQMMDTRLETCIEIGKAVAAAVKERTDQGGERPLIVASSDMSHYIPAKEAKEQDQKAITKMLALDAQGLYYTVKEEHITMCGYGPAVAMLTACKDLGATRAELIKYTNSGDVSGDYEQVVGYAGIVVC